MSVFAVAFSRWTHVTTMLTILYWAALPYALLVFLVFTLIRSRRQPSSIPPPPSPPAPTPAVAPVPVLRSLNQNPFSDFLKTALRYLDWIVKMLFNGTFSSVSSTRESTAGMTKGAGFLKNVQILLLDFSHGPSQDLIRGLVNKRNSCFINSVLQSLAALQPFETYLVSVLEDVGSFPDSLAFPLKDQCKVTFALLSTLYDLKYSSELFPFYPSLIMQAFSNHRRVFSEEQQDAQEFFQTISAAISNEASKIYSRLRMRDVHDLKWLLSSSLVRSSRKFQNPFTGLIASRLTCADCGFTAAVRHFTFDNLSLSLPNTTRTSLEACLQDYTKIETLYDANCRVCSLRATLKWYEGRLSRVDLSTGLREELEERRMEVEKALKTDPEKELEKVNLCKKGASKKSTKQVMIAKSPKLLCLHLSRSDYFSDFRYAYKNSCVVQFPLNFDLGQFCTNGELSTEAYVPLSNAAKGPNVWYRLKAMIVHYGSHYDGHFIAYRALSDGWWRISDERVFRVTQAEVLSENPYMLFYERMDKVSVLESIKKELNLSEAFKNSSFDSPPSSPPVPVPVPVPAGEGKEVMIEDGGEWDDLTESSVGQSSSSSSSEEEE